MSPGRAEVVEPDPGGWPILVTGAGGFVGGCVARHLAQSGHRVRGLVRSRPIELPGDPPIEWILGDLRNPEIVRTALTGMRGVIHAAAWVSLGRDDRGLSRSINVDATRRLLREARHAGIKRFIYTSTLHTLAAGTRENPADEESTWNLQTVDSPYCRTKREAESLVRSASDQEMTTVVLCPGMVLGPRAPKPTSTRLVRALANTPVAVVPLGGIPIIDSRVVATAHRRALIAGRPGDRYALAGSYLSYVEIAKIVAEIAGRPWTVLVMPDFLEAPAVRIATLCERLLARYEISAATVAGGYLRLYVSGRKGDECFGLAHPPVVETIRDSLSRTADATRLARSDG